MKRKSLFLSLVLTSSLAANAVDVREEHSLYYEQGVNYEKNGEYKNALTNYLKASSLMPRDTATLAKIALVLFQDLNKQTREKSLTEAIAYLEKANSIKPNDTAIKLLLAQSYQHKNKYKEAIKYYKEAIRLEPENSLLKLNLGLAYFETKNFKEAIELLNKVVLAYPDNLKARGYLGAALQSTENYLAAIEQYKYILKYEKENFSIIKNTADSWLALEQYDRARESYGQAQTIDPNVPDIYADLAYIDHKSKKLGPAIENYQKALELRPENDSWRRSLAHALWSNEDLDKAVTEFETVEDYNVAAYLYQNLDKKDKAIDLYNKAVEKDPEDTKSRFNLGRLYHEKEDYEKAKSQYLSIIEQKPNDSQTIFMLGVAEQEDGAVSEAIKYYNELLAKSDEFQEKAKTLDEAIRKNIYYNLGLAHKAEGELKKAEENFEMAYERGFNPKEDLYKELVFVKQELGKKKEAKNLLLDWLKQEPTNVAARNIYADLLILTKDSREAIEQLKLASVLDKTVGSRLKLANLLQNENQLFDALAEFQLVIEEDPDNLEAILGAANNYRLLKLKDEAVQAYKIAAEKFPDSVTAHYNYGLVLQEVEKTKEALIEHEKVRELDPEFLENYYSLGLAYWDLGSKDQAVTAWNKFKESSEDEKLIRTVEKMINEYNIGLKNKPEAEGTEEKPNDILEEFDKIYSPKDILENESLTENNDQIT